MTDNTLFSLSQFIQSALNEDVGTGDHTTAACVSADQQGIAHLVVKEAGVVAGLEVAAAVFKQVNAACQYTLLATEGQWLGVGDQALEVHGPVAALLTAERTALNILQRMSGIATTTNRFVKAVAHTRAKLLDTRKTTPGMRWLEKEAVRIGGGYNHRTGLFDMILIKNNHVDAAGGVSQAVAAAVGYKQKNALAMDIEVEVRNAAELEAALGAAGVSRIMLDNFSVPDTADAVRMVAGRVPLESSGGIHLQNVRFYAETGVDYISVGALTHSVKSLDYSLKIVPR